MTEQYVLFGAGTIGRVVARQLAAQGNPPVAFADNDPSKQKTVMEGVGVERPFYVQTIFPEATWIATAMQPKFREELLKQIEEMGVKSASLWDFMAKRYELPPVPALDFLVSNAGDDATRDFIWDQYEFRRHQGKQIPAAPMEEIYFPDWIVRLDDEYYIDCGAADGDTVLEFRKRWKNYAKIRAFEPDEWNYRKLEISCLDDERTHGINAAVSDFSGRMSFTSTGDYSAHTGGESANATVNVYRLDTAIRSIPTYIKMDIEGSELEALWGARRIIKEHSPVLAICAYHTADHLWQIPLLIYAINPTYKLFLRRYAEGTWETVWYGVPPDRIVK